MQKGWSHSYLIPLPPNILFSSFQIEKNFIFSCQAPKAAGKCNGMVTEKLKYKSGDPRRHRVEIRSSTVTSQEESCPK